MPFGVPMKWSNPGRSVHNSSKCYVCANDICKRNKSGLKKFRYISVPSVQLPQSHSEHVPVPKRPSPAGAAVAAGSGNEFIAITVEPSVFLPGNEIDNESPSREMTEKHLHCLARKLGLSKTKAEVLASELRAFNVLAAGVNVTSFRDRNEFLKPFFTVNDRNTFVFCNDINGLLNAMGSEYVPEEWRFFIDSSQSSLKGIFKVYFQKCISKSDSIFF